jgi:hypothetical protein
MWTRHLIVAAAVALFAGALLYAVDHNSFLPQRPQTASVPPVR